MPRSHFPPNYYFLFLSQLWGSIYQVLKYPSILYDNESGWGEGATKEYPPNLEREQINNLFLICTNCKTPQKPNSWERRRKKLCIREGWRRDNDDNWAWVEEVPMKWIDIPSAKEMDKRPSATEMDKRPSATEMDNIL